MNELIDPYTNQWDKELVRDNFWQIGANRILGIPLTEGLEDLLHGITLN
jgi:hypothetical protein